MCQAVLENAIIASRSGMAYIKEFSVMLITHQRSMLIMPSNEIILEKVREFINALKEQLIKDWCVQSWVKTVTFGTSKV